MTRIIGGVAGGRRIGVPAGSGTRPTADRVREALFSSLESEFGSFHGLAVLDLYAGSGAIGLEALSRGAATVVLVESDRKAAEVIAANIKVVGLPGATLLTRPVEKVAAGDNSGGPFDLVFADPPYKLETAELQDVLTDLRGARLARRRRGRGRRARASASRGTGPRGSPRCGTASTARPAFGTVTGMS